MKFNSNSNQLLFNHIKSRFYNLLIVEFLKKNLFTVLAAILTIFYVAGVTPLTSKADAQVFALTSVPDNFTSVYTDTVDPTRTITVTLEPQNTACASFNAAGRADVFATSSNAACDRSIAMTFQTSGFALNSIGFNDIDDMDGIAPRDSFSASVAGTWTSPTIEIHTFASPPAFADQAARLSGSGGVGTFLANAFGENNPTNETATFTLTNPTSSLTIYFDDVEGARNARAFFNLDPLGASVNPNADLVTVKSLVSGDAEPSVGDTVTFQIVVTNNGPADAKNVSLTDLLPADLTATGNNGNVTAGSYAGSGVWTIGPLDSGDSEILTLEGTVVAGQGGQTIQNVTSAASGDEPDPSTAGDDLTESVVVDNHIVANDDDFSGTPIASSGGNTASVFTDDTLNVAGFANGAVIPSITDPDGLTGVSINADGTLTIPAGSTPGTYNVEYQICEVGNPTNCDTAIATIVIGASVDLAITKTNTPGVNGEVDQTADTVTSGTTTTYTLVATNNGPDSVTGAIVTDTPTSGITCPGTNTVTITGDGVPVGSFTISNLTGGGIALATLANGQSATLTFSCQVN
tara:strand:+ start:19942 stop:21672 length:1731 start_codon:yes stop_codon:yes gene_type:complete